MKFFLAIFAVVLAVARAQFGFGFRDFSSGFGGFGSNSAVSRDPRANTGSPLVQMVQMPNGPVLFPAAPADNGQTSGVVVGASGYGFVPPNDPSARPIQSLNYF